MLALLDQPAARHIAAHMRESDRVEVSAVAGDDLVLWSDRITGLPGAAMMVLAGGEPAAMGGAIMMGHHAVTWFVATDRIAEPAVRADVHRMALVVHREVAKEGVRRFTAQPMTSNEEAARWLKRLGYRHEGDHPGHGRRGESFSTWGKVIHGH